MADVAQLEADLALERGFATALRGIRGSGMLRVTYADRTVQYQSTAALSEALLASERRIAEIERQLGLPKQRGVTRQVTFIAGKGL